MRVALILMLFMTSAGMMLYLLLLRPMLRRWSVLREFWASADAYEISLWQKVRELFDGLKIKLLARLVWVPTAIAYVYDRFTDLCSGCDLTPVTSLLPSWMQGLLPIFGALVVPVLIDWARSYSSARPPEA